MRQYSGFLPVAVSLALTLSGCAKTRSSLLVSRHDQSVESQSANELAAGHSDRVPFRPAAQRSSSQHDDLGQTVEQVHAEELAADKPTDREPVEVKVKTIAAAYSSSSEAIESQDSTTESTSVNILSLGNILYLADAQNPNVILARERISEAYSRVERAEALWLPSLRAGLNYNHHEGTIQDVAGKVFETNRSAFGGGFGANMVGAASPGVPGLIAQFHLTDAIFQPKIASHQAASRQFAATAARNDVLRDAAVAYLELVRAEQGTAIARDALRNTEKLAELTRQYATTGQGLRSDFERMETELSIRRDVLVKQEEAIQVASARLAQVLHADPSVQLTSGEPVVTPLDVMQADDPPAAVVALGLSRRPELSEQKHLVCEAVERLNREKYAPLIPSVLLGMSYGGMGGGLGNAITNSGQRWDADAVAYWELRNLGFGDRAAQGETASIARQAHLREVALLDRVAREVVEAHAQVVQRKRRLEVTRDGIAAADRSYRLNQQRIENAQGLPIEVLQSIQALATVQQSYLNAVIDYNIAQFELCRATGWFVDA